jgi:ABC-type sugar transport system substrate-binding protein
LDKAAYLTALLAFGSLLAGSMTGIIVQSITGMGFATGLVAFVQAASKATEFAPKASIVPNVPQQAEELSASIEQEPSREVQSRLRGRGPYS